ncbi:LysR family transcriptional regulator [Planotetraspora phitsanulokensis]|uniref:LysR family transcriptional regulator n=1 Tax=Planotetraspora phitsanulokensis TaxID=575192 RepID=A0A8J3UGR5_9ACTN|nr:LysR family transcriptional regulator [Planotetraspora phitsanulokensis]GII38610.1 LysR family transcriptional regulator [Planotetraspora phitsanulokensis]
MGGMPPDFESLRLLTLVAELGSLGQAAERMRISQPAASKRLAMLERRLGLTLVDRSSRGSALTTEGKAVCQWSDRVLSEVESLMAGAAALRADQDDDLRLASSMTLAEHFVPRWIGALRHRSPDLRVSLKVTNSEQAAELAARGQVGIGFIEAPTVPPGLCSRQVGADRLVVVVAPGHPWLRRRRPVEPAELARTPLIVREPGSGTRETLERILADVDVEPARPLVVLDSNAAMRAAVAAGVGPAVLSVITVREELAEGRVREVPLAGVNLHRRLRAVWPRGRRPTGAAELLLGIASHRLPDIDTAA